MTMSFKLLDKDSGGGGADPCGCGDVLHNIHEVYLVFH